MTAVVLSTRDEAVARAERIRTGIESMASLQEDIAAAYHRRDWTTLGYGTWDAYVSGEFGEQRLKLSRQQRQEIVASLRGEGLSTRAIGTALGVGQQTVVRDLAADSHESAAPATVTGVDGKTYASRPTPSPAPEPTPAPPEPRRRPLTEDADEAARALDAAIRRWERITTDNRWTTNHNHITERHTALFNHTRTVLNHITKENHQ